LGEPSTASVAALHRSKGRLGYPVLERRPMGGRGSGRASGSVWHPRKTTAGPPRACARPCSPIVGRWRSECEPALIPPRRSPAAWPAPCSNADPSPLPALVASGTHEKRPPGPPERALGRARVISAGSNPLTGKAWAKQRGGLLATDYFCFR
jgi:hypothetical protein